MKNITSLLLCIGLIISPIACTNLEDINIDPTRPSEVDLKYMLPEAMTQTMFNQGANPARIAGLVIQQFKSFDAMKIPYNGYGSSEATFDSYWIEGLYAGSLRSAKLIAEQAEAENAPHYAGIGKVLLAAGYGDATSYFGDIPFSDALRGIESLNPAFDTQEQVYEGVQTLLDEAIDDFSQADGGQRPGVDDLIFGGDVVAWTGTAYALKARYLMHTIKRNPGAASTILDIIRNKAFQSKTAQPGFTWGTTQISNNPLAKFGTERPNTIVIDNRFAERMETNTDPRQDAYMTLGGYNDYYYFINGTDGQLVWAQNNSTIPLISFEELKFIEAELEWMQGNEANAKALLLEAVATNMAHVGIDGTDYIAALGTTYDTAIDKYEIIMNEAYTAYYGQAFHQSWANFRRTGYPKLIAPPESNTVYNPGGGILQRYLYPLSEVELNSANVQVAVDRQDGALMNVPVWAFE